MCQVMGCLPAAWVMLRAMPPNTTEWNGETLHQ